MRPGERAEARIAELGVTSPAELDVELIAADARMTVVYEDLHGCEATLIGVGNRAIATIKPSPSRGRQRFSVAHELGHWLMHRGLSFRCRVDDMDLNLSSDQVREREADSFASHLLMPTCMFHPALKSFGTPDFLDLEKTAEVFKTSLLATCMRLADINTLPVMLACYSASGLRWYMAAGDIPRRWFLRQQLDDDSFAYAFLHQGKARGSLGIQSGETWFENDDAHEYELRECCHPGRNGEVLVILYLGSKMLHARYDPNVGQRKYNENGSYVVRGKPTAR
jgi:hypothetical protein